MYIYDKKIDTKHVILLGISFVYELIFGHVGCNIVTVAFSHPIR